MAVRDTGFNRTMEDVLRGLRPVLVKKMSIGEDFLAYLVSERIFETTEYIEAQSTPSGKNRKLLDDLLRRPGADFWKFVWILFHTHQGHFAELILQKYESQGGIIPADTRRLRDDYHQSWLQPPAQTPAPQLPWQNPQPRRDVQPHPAAQQNEPRQPLAHFPAPVLLQNPQPWGDAQLQPAPQRNVPQHILPQQPQQQAPGENDPGLMDVDAPGGFQTFRGNPLSQDSGGGGHGERRVIYHEESDSRQENLDLELNAGDRNRVLPLTKYYQERQENPNSVFRMDSSPRGILVLINNEYFEYMDNRDGTIQDQEVLFDVFENRLGFHTILHPNCTAQRMIELLQEFATNPDLHSVDSIVVAIFSHGCQGDTIFGTDGRTGIGGRPASGYVTLFEVSSIFSATNCPAMQGKPKLFIIQACRGVLEDRRAGSQPVRRDIQPEHPPEGLYGPNFKDLYYLFATVENYVAYRGQFVQLLANVLREHADTRHVKDIATRLHNEMSRVVLDGHIFMIGQERGNLTRDWFLNPPTTNNS